MSMTHAAANKISACIPVIMKSPILILKARLKETVVKYFVR